MRTKLTKILLGLAFAASSLTAHAALVAIGEGDFSGAETLVSYTGEAGGAVNGRTIGGVLHNSNGAEVLVTGSPFTQLIQWPAVFGDSPSETLGLTFAGPQKRIGFTFALEPAFTSVIVNGATIELFDALDISLGSLSFNASIPPGTVFPEGFAGIQSDMPFVRAQIAFASNQSWALDNLRFEAVPEPGTLALLGLGLAGLAASRRRKQ